jgi:tRNA-2-methylthio-N6-dimethylallyladenosine synthase
MVDGERLRGYLRANNWRLSDSVEDADVVILSVCGVTAETAFRGVRFSLMIGGKCRAGARVIVTGCLGGMGEAETLRRAGLEPIPPRGLAALDGIIHATTPWEAIADPNTLENVNDEAEDLSVWDRFRSCLYPSPAVLFTLLNRWCDTTAAIPFRKMFNIRVAVGCLDECAYCALRQAHGPLTSRPLSGLVRALRAAIQQGRREIALVGADVGAWGQDCGTDCLELFRAFFALPGDYRLFIGDFNPRWLVRYRAGLVELLGAHRDRISGMLLPVQSGSDRILAAMRRSCVRADLEASLCELRAALPAVRLSTHIMIGFPGESEEDFEATLALLAAVRFDEVTVYKYGDRAGTAAAAMPAKIGEWRKLRRLWRYKRAIVDRQPVPA